MISEQQGDVLLYQTDDGGEIDINDGVFSMTGGLETAVYLALFGGNEDDDGRPGNQYNWWGNLGETEPEKQYRSETQFLLKNLPATSANRLRIEDAVSRDLAVFVDNKLIDSFRVSAVIAGVDRVDIRIELVAGDQIRNLYFKGQS